MKNREQIKNFPMYEKGYFSATFKKLHMFLTHSELKFVKKNQY